MKVKTVLLIFVGILTIFSQTAHGENLFVDSANRWAFIIDASTVDTENDSDNGESYTLFKSELQEAGFLADHILIFSTSSKDRALWPSRENIAKILDGIKNPERNRVPEMPGAKTGKQRLRTKDGPCEVQLYVTAGGVANKEQTRNMIVPAGIKADDITRTDDDRLVSLSDFEDALTAPGEDQLPIERTLLVVNFLSLHTVTRGNAANVPFRGVNISKVPVRGAQDTMTAMDSSKYLHLRILTKNEQVTDQTAESFYQTLEKGMHGFADISGNQDGIVQAGELVEYIETNMRLNSVEVARNGNDPFPVSKARQSIEIPDGLFNTIGKAFTQETYSAERESAYQRAQAWEQKKGAEQ